MGTASIPFRKKWSTYVTVSLFLLLGFGPLISHPETIDYIVSNQRLKLLPWGACCALKGPVSELLGLEAVVALLYLEMIVISPLSISTAFLIWRQRKIGGHLGIYLSLVRTGILLFGFAVPIGIVHIIPLLLVRRIWVTLR